MYEFVGRVDQQVKIRGFRVELGEIESHLNRLTAIRECAVVLKTDAANHQSLIAFWVPAVSETSTCTAEEIAEQLKRVLPAYMVPARFEMLQSLPLTPNLKVDRKFLTRVPLSAILEQFAFAPVLHHSGTAAPTVSLQEVIRQVSSLAAGILKIEVPSLEPDRPLGELGFDSIRFTSLSVELNRVFRLNVDATLFYHYKTIRGLAEFLLQDHPELFPSGNHGTIQRASQNEDDFRPVGSNSRTKPAERTGTDLCRISSASAVSEPIAIIGMDARFPGAANVEIFWQNLLAGKDVIREFPWERIGQSKRDPAIQGGFIDDVDKFDAPFFGISPREATAMDPRQRLFLEAVWRAIEDSGHRPSELSGTNTGVFVGIVGGAEYSGEPEDTSMDFAAQLFFGAASSLIANRVSYHLDLRGPSAPIDTACSGSLVALHRAVVALQSGQCELAIVGGVNLILDPELNVIGAKTGMLSPDSRCKAFDEQANGYVRGEGVVALLLRPLSQARAEFDPIYAIIRGSAESHSGRAAGLTVPNPQAQSEVVVGALERAGIGSETVTYVEAHGTGTQLGDPIEVQGLKVAFEKANGSIVRPGYCGLGSVKTNVGHLEAVAGLAGVIKVVLAMRHGILPGNLHFQRCNPKIQLEGSPFFVVDRNLPWSRLKDDRDNEIPRRAGVSSYGFSGENVHVVIEEFTRPPSELTTRAKDFVEPELILLSARTKERLRVLAEHLADHLDGSVAAGSKVALRDLAYTLQLGREAMTERAAFVAETLEEVCRELRRLADGSEGAALMQGTLQDKGLAAALTEGHSGELFVDALIKERDWCRLGQLWVAGASVGWRKLYRGDPPHRLSLPAYPFDRRRYWLSQSPPADRLASLGPLLDGLKPSWEAGAVFTKRFSSADSILADHQVNGIPILPGVVYLEMARAAAAAMSPGQPVQLRSVVWLKPLESKRAEDVRLHLQRQDDRIVFSIESWTNGEKWVHARGEVGQVSPVAPPEMIDLAAVRKRCSREFGSADLYHRFSRVGVQYGPYFQTIDRLWLGSEEALARLRLPSVLAHELDRYVLHPSLLDGALQTAAGMVLTAEQSELRLPFSVASVDMLKPLTGEIWVYAHYGAGTDLMLINDQGEITVRLNDYQTRPVKDLASQERSATAVSVLAEVLGQVEATPNSAFGFDPQLVDSELKGFELLEWLGCLTLLKGLQDRGLFHAPGEEISRDALRAALNAVPKYYRLCNSLIHFLRQKDFADEIPDGARAGTALAEPEIKRALADLPKGWEDFYRAYPNLISHGLLLRNCIEALHDVISGRIVPTDVMFPNGSVDLINRIYQGSILMDYSNRIAASTVRGYAAATLRRGGTEKVRILEVGAGAGATTEFVAEAVREFGDRVEYVYTDISIAFKRYGERHFGERYPFMRFERLDIEKPLTAQGFVAERFDVVLGANVIHTTRLLHRSVQTCKALLKRNGIIVLVEGTEARIFNGLTYGLLDGWWLVEDADRRIENAPLLTADQWHRALVEEGFHGVHVPGRSNPRAARLFQAVMVGESDGVFSPDVLGHSADTSSQPGLLPTNSSVSAPIPGGENRTSGRLDPKQILMKKVSAAVRQVLQTEADELHSQATFDSLGVDSILSLEIVDKLNAELPVKLRSTDLFNYATIAKLVERLVSLLTDEARQQLLAAESPISEPVRVETAESVSNRAETSEIAYSPRSSDSTWKPVSPDSTSIAIIGYSGQFPDAPDLVQFWVNLRAGKDAVHEVPPSRWSIDEFYSESRTASLKSYSKWGGFLSNAAEFDPLFFNISPREADYMDPQQRIFMMESWRALEDAGYSNTELDTLRCGVFVGCGASDYDHRLSQTDHWAESYAFTGNASSILAARIAYHLNLKGPAIAVDTACSSSLVAMHLACESLRLGTSDLALAGGVTVIATPRLHIFFSRLGMLSPVGRVQSFGQRADGFVPAEGVGVLVLKRLEDALRDGDQIQAIIRGSGINQDGKTNGITAPSAPSQAALEIDVYERFGIHPETIGYVECHGTGTRLGDPIEIEGLTNAFRRFTNRQHFCGVGSVKSSIGHALAAAGVAGVIKVLLAMKHGELPPTLHCDQTNEHIEFGSSPFFVNRELQPWNGAGGHSRRAAVSAFSFNGTNAHLVLEEGPLPGLAPQISKPAYLITLSAATETALRRRLQALADWLESADAAAVPLESVSFTLNAGRSHFQKRFALVARSLSDLRQDLLGLPEGDFAPDRRPSERPRNHSSNLAGPAQPSFLEELEKLRSHPELYIGRLNELREFYLNGGEIVWRSLHAGESNRRVSLPTYPFEKRAFWIEPTPRRALLNRTEALGPLLDRPLPSLDAGGIFVKRFDPTDQVLAEHQVGGRPILPGVAYLEMAHEGAQALAPNRRVELHSVTWLRPLEGKSSPFEAYLKVRQEGGRTRFAIESLEGDESRIHCQGDITWHQGLAVPERLDLEVLRKECTREMEPEAVYQLFSVAGVVYGNSFQTVKRMWFGPGDVLGELGLAADAVLELKKYTLHPGLLDGALQVAAGMALNGDSNPTEPKLPFSVERVQILGPLSKTVWVHVRGHLDTGAEITLTDDRGLVCVKLSGYLTRSPKDKLADICFTPGWIEKSLEVAEERIVRKVWLVFAQSGPLESALLEFHPGAQQIQLSWESTRLSGPVWRVNLHEPNAWGQAIETLAKPELVYFVTGPVTGFDELDRVRRGQEQGVTSLFRLIKAGQKSGWLESALRLKVVTRNVWSVAGVPSGEPYSSAVSGLIGSLGREYPGVEATCIDVGEITSTTRHSAVAAIVHEPAHRKSQKIAWRHGKRYEMVLWPTDLPAVRAEAFRRGGVYVIVGGAGGIGGVLSAHLSRKYGARMAWIGRRPLDGEIKRSLKATADQGGELLYLQADVANQAELESAFAVIKARWGEVHGVVHSALVLRDLLLERMEERDFVIPLAAKVSGLALLAGAAKSAGAEWLMVFSSVQSFYNNVGQSNYAAGSIFADLFARWVERSTGLRTHVINWGYWGSVGIVANDYYRAALARVGMASIEVSEGIEAIERVIAHRLPSLTVLKGSPSLLQEFRVDRGRREIVQPARYRSVWDALRRIVEGTEAAALEPEVDALQRELAGLPDLERFGCLALAAQLGEHASLPAPGEALNLDAWQESLRVIPRHQRLFNSLIAILRQAGFIESVASEWRVTEGLHRAKSAGSQRSLVGRYEELLESRPELAGHAELLLTCVRALPTILQGKQAATEVMFPGGSLRLVEKIYKGTTLTDHFNRLIGFAIERAVSLLLQELPPETKIRIVEIGAGTGSTTESVALALNRHRERIDYVYSDVSTGFEVHFRKHFADRYPFMRFATIDLERGLAEQGLTAGSADIVLAANAVHVSSSLHRGLHLIKGLLAPNGLLALIEVTRATVFNTLTYGLLDGWWHFEDGHRRLPNAPLLSCDQWREALIEEGFRRVMAAEKLRQIAVGDLQSLVLAENDGSFLVTTLESSPAAAKTLGAAIGSNSSTG